MEAYVLVGKTCCSEGEFDKARYCSLGSVRRYERGLIVADPVSGRHSVRSVVCLMELFNQCLLRTSLGSCG